MGDASAILSGCATSCKTKAGGILEESGAGVKIVHVDNVAFVFEPIIIYKAHGNPVSQTMLYNAFLLACIELPRPGVAVSGVS